MKSRFVVSLCLTAFVTPALAGGIGGISLGGGGGGISPPRFGNPINDIRNGAAELDRQRLEAQRRAEQQARAAAERLNRERIEAQRQAAARAAELDRQRLEAQHRAEQQARAAAERAHRERLEAQRRAAELDRQRLEAQRQAQIAAQQAADRARQQAAARAAEFERQRQAAEGYARQLDQQRLAAQGELQQRYEQARRQVRELVTISSNKDEVRANLSARDWRVALGKEIDHAEEYNFASAIAASAVSGEPGPVLVYIEYIVAATKAEVTKNLQRAGEELGSELETKLVQALDRALKTGRTTDFTFRGLDLKVGVATYKNWKKISGEYPRIDRGNLTMEYAERTIDLPNTFQPYVAFRLRYEAEPGKQVIAAMPIGFPEVRPEVRVPFSPLLGINYEPQQYRDGTFALRVKGAPAANSPADELGFEDGDLIYALDGVRFRTSADVENHTGETTVDFINVRNGQKQREVFQLP